MLTTKWRKGAVALLALVVATLGIFVPSVTANATNGGGSDGCTWLWNRSVPQSHLEYKYQKTQYKYAKYTHTKTREWVEGTPASPDLWWNWSPNKTQEPQDYEPAFPNDPRGTWQGPHENGGPMQDTYGTFQTSSPGNSNWFHREHGTPGTDGHWGEWSAYGPWTLWTPLTHVTWEDFNVEAIGAPAYHGSGTYSDGTEWYREWQARNTGETRTVAYNNGDWTTDTPGDPWVKVDERTVQDPPLVQGPVRSADEPDRGNYPDVAWVKDPSSKECPPTQVDVPGAPETVDPCNPQGVTDNVAWKGPLAADTDQIDWSESSDGRTRTATLKGNAVWKDGTTAPKVFTLPADSGEKCEEPPTQVDVPGAPETVDPCNPQGVTDNVAWKGPLAADTDQIDWSESSDGRTRTATLKGNAVWKDGTTAPKVFTLPADSGEKCDVPPDDVLNPKGHVTVTCKGGTATLNNSGSTVKVTYELVVDGNSRFVPVKAGVTKTVKFAVNPGSTVKLWAMDAVLDSATAPTNCGGHHNPPNNPPHNNTPNPPAGPGGEPAVTGGGNSVPIGWIAALMAALFAGLMVGGRELSRVRARR